MEPWYCLRETVKLSVDIRDSVRANAQIDRIIADVSRTIDNSLCRRVFYPRTATQTFDWPHADRPTPGRLWLGKRSEIATLTALSAGGTSIPTGSVLLYPTYGPPYTRLEIDQSSTASFSSGATAQQAITVSAVFAGAPLDDRSVALLGEALDASETSIDVDSAPVTTLGVGALLLVGTERMAVFGARALDTAVNTAGAMTDLKNNVTVALSSAVGAPQPMEIITIDAERMLVTDLIGTTLHVQRGYDGTPVAAHLSGTDIYAYRTLVVERGAVGTTATTHDSGAAVKRWYPPGPVEGLAVAETLNQIEQERSAYARVIGAGENQRESRGAGLKDKRTEVRKAYGRRVRMGAV